ncbi:uncharacterized protein L203_100707 [Cryptococcus depauperatus CBS 7841]|uniref:Zn(2)-C6 fungal-type domain-containing protein n=1 Tax=Cryptococcus depauperatus CBS 7841 TaxID=1295531 RepID=A0AAJ8JNL6_9TREE
MGYGEDTMSKEETHKQGSATQQQPLKRRRITRACDRCHRGGIRCAASLNPSVCAPCADFGSECTYNRPMKRRGPPARNRDGQAASNAPLARWFLPSDVWSYREVATHEQIEQLVDAYYAIAYPLYSIFHWPTFTENIRRKAYMAYPAFHALTMSVCALASARLRDGASASPHARVIISSPFGPPGPTSETFYQAAVASYPRDLTRATDFDYKRAKPLLATLAIQYGEIPSVHAHIGDYMTLCAIDGFHNESRWPSDLNEIEVQERRRLFWLAYQLDVYTATTWGGIIRHRESQSTVLYPTEVFSDDEITAAGIVTKNNNPRPVSFLRGWNFIVDLYRILEHAVSRLRTRNHTFDTGNQIGALFSEERMGNGAEVSPTELLTVVERLYSSLPAELKIISEMTGDSEKDIYGFQAANILVTLQTVKMVIAGMAEWSVEQRCAIAGELLEAFSKVPRAYIQATSTPLLHHLAGVGHLLASIIHSPLSPSVYLHVRTILLSMADLLSSLETSLTNTTGIAPKLRDHVERIDRYMATAAENGKGAVLGAFSTQKDQTRHQLAPKETVHSTNPNLFSSRHLDVASAADSTSAHVGPGSGVLGYSSNSGLIPTVSSRMTTSSKPTCVDSNGPGFYPNMSSRPPPPLRPKQPKQPSTVGSFTQSQSSSGPAPSISGPLIHFPFGNVNDMGGDNLQRREPLAVTPGSSTHSTPPQFSPNYIERSPQGGHPSIPQQQLQQTQRAPQRPANQTNPNQQVNLSSIFNSQQTAYQLPDDLFVDWPFLFNEYGFQGDAFDFLSSNVGAPSGEWQGAESSTGAVDNVGQVNGNAGPCSGLLGMSMGLNGGM